MKDQIVWGISAIIYLAILYTLVRPGSKGTAIIGQISTTFADLVRGVTGQTFDPQTNKWSTGP